MTQAQLQETTNQPALDHQPANRKWQDYFSFNTDHKVIGTQYLVTTFVFYCIGGMLADLLRTELKTPENDFVSPELYNSLFTLHGTIMIFLWIIPAGVGFANYLIPLMIGAKDMAFPRLNAVSFWIIPPAGILLISSLLLGDAPDAGWTSYPPLSLVTGQVGEAIWIMSLLLLGTSSILGAINLLVTILKMRIPSMGVHQMPIFCWSMFATSALVLVSTPVLTALLILVAFDLLAGTSFFRPAGGGEPVIYQHMFWFYSHPAVYIMILPFFGAVSDIFPVHARKPLFGYKAVAYSSLAISFLALIVWVHHMFTSGTPGWIRMFFMITTMIVSVPTGIKVFSWLATIWGGKLQLNSAMLFAMGFVGTFTIGGISGVMLGAVPFNISVHDTYFVVAHLHYVLFGGSVLGIYAAIYHWFPKMTGRMLNEFWGRVHFALTVIGLNLTFMPMHKLGMIGMNRRIAMYDPKFETLNFICTMGAYLLGASTFPFIINAIWSWRYGPKAGNNPWNALTLEWMTTSPPAIENFETIPVLATGPYDYGMDNLKQDIDVPLSDEKEPALAAGPNSVLRAAPDPEVTAHPGDSQGT